MGGWGRASNPCFKRTGRKDNPLRKVSFITDLFRKESDRKRSEKALGLFLCTLAQLNIDFLRDNPNTPNLYDAGIVYKREPIPVERWKMIPEVLADGYGDCEDLACWLAAELRVKHGISAKPVYKVQKKGRLSIYHIVVKLPNGRILDPSKHLGM